MAGFLLFPGDEALRANRSDCTEPGGISVIPAPILALLRVECTMLLRFKATSVQSSGTKGSGAVAA